MSSSGRGGGRGRGRGRGGGGGRGTGGDKGKRPMVQEVYAPTPPPAAAAAAASSRPAYVAEAESSSHSGLNRDISKLSIQQDVDPPPDATVTVPISSKAVRPPPRPGFGSVGTNRIVFANHFAVSMNNPEIEVHHYDVSITPEVTSKRLNRMVITQLVRSYGESHLGNRLPAYDGRKNIYTVGSLPFVSNDFVVMLEREDGSGREREFKVSIRFAVKLDFFQLTNFLQRNQMDSPHELIQCLDIILRSSPAQNHLSVGRSFYSLNFGGPVNLGNGVECWKGYYQSLRPTQMGLSLNIDLSATSFFEPLTVLKFIETHLGVKHTGQPMSDVDRTKVRRALRGVRVAGMHRPGYKIKYRISGISTLPANELLFDGPGKVKMSVTDFFRQKYGRILLYGDWPCVQAGNDAKPSYLPLEVCQIVPGQRFVKKLNENQVRRMLTSTCIRPNIRQENISQTVGNNGFSDDEFLREFGLSVTTNPTRVRSRVLPPPELMYKDMHGRSRIKSPDSGTWNMNYIQAVEGGKVDYWACLNFSRNYENTVCRFTDTLIEKCRNIGMQFVIKPLHYSWVRPFNCDSALRDAAADCSRQLPQGKHLQLLIIVLPEASGLYGKIKTICETDLGIVTQCCKPKQVLNCNPNYQENVALKINVKVGGRNTFVSKLDNCLPKMMTAPVDPTKTYTSNTTIIFGADVTHPAPGDDSCPSIAAVVASMEWPNVTKYRCLVSAQGHRDEIIHDLYKPPSETKNNTPGGMIRDHLVAFFRATNTKPRCILFYRDGVSEGQFSQVLFCEMDAIRKACQSLEEDYLPTVTFVVVQKRHHTRLFPSDKAGSDRSGNVLPGTVVDTSICHPTEFDFYLCSHTGVMGTSRPTHYHVLFDENGFSADQIQLLTNYLCYTYARCTRSVSLVPPVYYAHLAAFRARYYIEDGISPPASPGGGSVVRQLPPIKDIVNSVMFFC